MEIFIKLLKHILKINTHHPHLDEEDVIQMEKQYYDRIGKNNIPEGTAELYSFTAEEQARLNARASYSNGRHDT